MNAVSVILASIVSGILLYACFPPLDLSFLAWFALSLPLTLVNTSIKYSKVFLMFFLIGIILCGLHIKWINEVEGFPIMAFFVLVSYGALFFGLFGLLLSLIMNRLRWPVTLIAPPLWVAIEFIRSNLSFLAIPWALLGYSQHDNTAIIQMASVTSVYGISCLIVLVNAAIGEVAVWAINRLRRDVVPMPSSNRLFFSIVATIIAVIIVYLWGNHQVKMFNEYTKQVLTASLIQGNIPQNEKWDSDFREKIMERYRKLTIRASTEHPDIVIWPESATPGYLRNDPSLYLAVRDIIREAGVPILLGSSSHPKILRDRKLNPRPKVSALLLDKNGRILSEYNKMRLLPFGEYLPLEGRFPWPWWLVPKSGSFVAGTYPRVFELMEYRFGVVICWENLFADIFRKFTQRGVQFMVNLTNEAWFGKTEASRQILAMSVFRAVENRISLLRAANTGISCIIDPLGRIQEKVIDEEGNDMMVTGILTASVPEPWGSTFYTRYGDVFAIACTIVIVCFLIMALLPVGMRRVFKISGL